ncbi:T9SS type A sorting domain-containing protein [Danxiaibacter flavus]|uniref:T9SS type A sorting domain-containing protein n=1 Tax=Danxiaibacter flavus TaxID=3049108 RepID=A0ABV3ZGJ3_9BACT|nr:T9SS type A sorting domain-containing protein [Chitinophagaceae bacterium DXS]
MKPAAHNPVHARQAWIFILCLIPGIASFSQTHKPISTVITPNLWGYYEHLPQGYSTSVKKYPLLVFFHGKAERGNGTTEDLKRILLYGPPKLINEGLFPKTFTVDGQQFSFIVISPQLRNREIPVDSDYNALMTYIKSRYRIDESRIYVTGLSLGAGRILHAAGSSVENAKSIAALTSASTDWSGDVASAKRIAAANLPIWLFGNTLDYQIPYSNTFWWYQYLKTYTPAMTNPPLIDSAMLRSHDSWTRMYDPNYRPRGLNVYEWMLKHKRSLTTESTATGPVAVIADPGDTIATTSVTLDASGSYTVAGRTITSWLWNYMAGPKNAIIENPARSITNIKNLTNGTYTFRVKVTDKAGSNSKTVTFTVKLPLAQRTATAQQYSSRDVIPDKDNNAFQTLKLSPIPANDYLNLSVVNDAKGKVSVYITDMSGRTLLGKGFGEKKAAHWSEKINISGLTGGSYFLTLLVGNEKFSGRFIKLSK